VQSVGSSVSPAMYMLIRTMTAAIAFSMSGEHWSAGGAASEGRWMVTWQTRLSTVDSAAVDSYHLTDLR
jgi:hypothetical protein